MCAAVVSCRPSAMKKNSRPNSAPASSRRARCCHLIPTALPAHQQAHQQRGNPRAPGRLHHRRDVRRGPLDHHLLHAPDQAQADHHLQGKPSALRRSTLTATPRTHTTWQPSTGRKSVSGIINQSGKKAV
jgi:hypothetical protein